jgi:GTP-binding protein
MADVPGLIEGAAEGKGLGHAFLRHLERTQLIAYLVTAVNDDGITPAEAFKTLRSELARYSKELAEKPACIILSKTDLIESDDRKAAIKKLIAPLRKKGFDVLPISSVENEGIDDLKRYLYDRVMAYKAEQAAENPVPLALDNSATGKLTRRWLEIPGVRLELTEQEAREVAEMRHPDMKKIFASC